VKLVMGRGFCPECRERAEKVFLDWDNIREGELAR